MHRQPSSSGVRRGKKTSYLHKEVIRNLQDIADREDKSFSYVVAEVVYSFFGLKVTKNDVVRLSRRIRRKKAKVIKFGRIVKLGRVS